MSFLMSNRTTFNLTFSPHLEVGGVNVFEELSVGCWAKFHKNPPPGICERPHVRLTIHQKDSGGRIEFDGRSCKGGLTADGLMRFQFSHKTDELKRMPEFGQSLSDALPIRLKPGCYLFLLPLIRRKV